MASAGEGASDDEVKKEGEFGSAADAETMEALEQDFQEVMEELQGDSNLDRFRDEYEKLHRALSKSQNNERKLVKKCRELNDEIVGNAAKVATALKLSEEDQGTIASLKKEIEKAWKMVDASHKKEAMARDNINKLKIEIEELNAAAEEGMSSPQDAQIAELTRAREELAEERDMQIKTILNLRNEIVEMQDKVRAAENKAVAAEHEKAAKEEEVGLKIAETEREMRKKFKLDEEIKTLRLQLDNRQVQLTEKAAAISTGEEQRKRLEQMLRDQRAAIEKAQREYDTLAGRLQKSQKDLDYAVTTNNELIQDRQQMELDLKHKHAELVEQRAETQKNKKLFDQATHRLRVSNAEREELQKSIDTLKREATSIEHDLEDTKKLSEAERKQKEDIARERDILEKLRAQAVGQRDKQIDLLRINESSAKSLEQEILGFQASARQSERMIKSLQADRERYSREASDANHKYLMGLQEIEGRQTQILDLQKKIAESENKLKQQQALYESVRSDRNLYSRNLIEAQDEMGEMKRKFKIMVHQIDQLKDEIAAKDLALVKEHFDYMKVEKEKEVLKFDLNKSRLQVKEADDLIEKQKREADKLNNIINEADSERKRQKKEYDVVINERDILGTQLIRRNDELALLYEKIKIQQSTLTKGQVAYTNRLNEIRVLKVKVNDLKRELQYLKKSVQNVEVLKREVHHLGRELLQERTKVKALSEELENPLNVHRWRRLEGSDPSAYEMVQKIQTLQKRLIAKTEEVVEKDLMIQEKEKLYVELKNVLSRQPGPEAAEQINVYQANLREKTRQMKAMASELNMYQSQVSEFKYEIDRLQRELQAAKEKYYDARRKEQDRKNKAAAEQQAQGFPTNPQGSGRYTGGGFSLAT